MEETEKKIESKTSRTAEFTCLARSASFYEKKPQYKSNDYIAPILVPKFFLPVIKFGPTRNFFINRFFPRGMYEYVIARTNYVDSIFENAIKSGFDQILIFGAGFDSRGIRFSDRNNGTRIFELDAPVTQDAKVNQLKNREIEINPDCVFISIDFNKESLEEKLLESGFKKNQRSLFILEGLTMYLDSEAVESTFNLISEFAGETSEILFDYVYSSVIRGENLYYGELEVKDGVKDEDEPWCFGIENGEIKSFLEKYDLELIHNLNSQDLEEKFFKDEQGNLMAKINGTHCITHAKKMG